jgi:hypothetical protein
MVVTRRYRDRAILHNIVGVFLITGALGCCMMLILFTQVPFEFRICMLALSFILYGLMVFIFILGVLGVMLTSVRIGLLIEIYKSGLSGIREKDLLRIFNRSTVTRERLFRLVTSGDIRLVKGRYILKRKVSPFLIHMYLQRLFLKIYF